jgi:integrase/recombinase XerD
MQIPETLNYPALYEQFKREKQYLENVSEATVQGYGWAWKSFEPIFKTDAVITKADVVAHVATLRAKGLTAVTINTYIRSFNTFFRWLQTEERCATLVKVPRLKEEKKMIEVFNDAQIRRLVSLKPSNKSETRIHTIACFVLDTGARVDEALSVERKDVDFDNLIVRIREGKGGKQRVVPISLQMRKLLFRHSQKNKPEMNDLLFFTGSGQKINQRNALRDFKNVCQRLGIKGPRCSFHTLRHTFGKNYIRNGGDVFRLQRILGHSKLEMTRRYVNLETSDLQQVHQQFSVLARASA